MTPREARGLDKHYPGGFQVDLTGKMALSLVLESQTQQEDRMVLCLTVATRARRQRCAGGM